MADPEGFSSTGATSELKRDLLREGEQFSFFQAMRLLRVLSRARTGGSAGPESPAENPPIRIRPKLSLAFPPADIDRIREADAPDAAPDAANDPASGYHITANFLGLYGSSAPLPTFYTEDLMDEAASDETVSRDFVDLVNQRIFELFYDCCIKYRQFFQVVEAGSPQHLERLFCLLGLGDKPLRAGVAEPFRLLRYIGLLTQKPRSGMGLLTLLRDSLDGIPVDVIPCVERRAEIPEDQKLILGGGAQGLGVDTVIGREIVDRMGKFRVQIGPLDSAGFQSFYPGAKNYQELCFLTDLYVLEGLAYDIEVILAEGEATTACLADPDRSRLGLNTWVFSSEQIGEVRKVYSPCRTGG